MTTVEAEIVCDADKVEPITAKLLALGFVIEEIIDWVEFSGTATIVAVVLTDLEPLAFVHYMDAIVDPFDTSPGAAILMGVAQVDRPVLVQKPRVLKRRVAWT